MTSEPPPSFQDFARWVALQSTEQKVHADRYQDLLKKAKAARDESAHLTGAGSPSNVEVLYLWAAASKDDTSLPPEVTTTRGFKVTLSYDEGVSTQNSSICVLVQSPPELAIALENRTVYIWYGTSRFELGQFDAEGKAMGVLPAGVQFSVSDFASGKIKLEEPDGPAR